MITVDIKGFAEVQRQLQNLVEKQMPYALTTALNNTAFAVQKVSKRRLQSAFDKPTPLVLGATLVTKATKQTLNAVVEIQPKRQVVLGVHEVGGPRGQKAFERKMGLPADWRAVPTKNVPLNQYGNPDPVINRRILVAKKGRARSIYFIMPGARSRQSPGVYQLVSARKIVKLYHFVKRVEYESRLDWLGTVQAEAEQVLPEAAARAVQRALETAR